MTTRLPVIGSTAKSTAFCSANLAGPGGYILTFDSNGKVTAGNGTLLEPKANCFSLPAAGISGIEHCPGSTETCRKACYVEGLNNAQPDLYALYERNASNIRAILADGELANAWVIHVAQWIKENAAGGFRWHVSGDCFSLEYAMWIADVVRESAPVRSWIYTRSLDMLAPLAEVSTIRGGNLAINISCDENNYEAACEMSGQYGYYDPVEEKQKFLRLAYLTVDGKVPEDLDADDIVFPDYALRPRAAASLQDSEFWQSITPFQRGLVCPVDAHSKSERNRCGLNHCSRCLK